MNAKQIEETKSMLLGAERAAWAKVKAASVAAPTEERDSEARCAGALGSMLFIVRVLSGDTRYSPDDAIFSAGCEIGARYRELKKTMGFEAAAETAKAEWLRDYLSSNTDSAKS